MKRIFSIFLAVLSVSLLLSLPVQLNQAETVAKNWFNYFCAEQGSDKEIVDYYTTGTEGKTDFYIFRYVNNGYVIVSGIDIFEPVLAFSSESDVELSFSKLAKQIEQLLPQFLNDTDINRFPTNSSWKNILENDFSHIIGNRDVSPMIFSLWGESDPWNDECPDDPDGPGNNAYAGSGGVAMSMLLKYWNHPANGVGQNSYFLPDYGEIFANFGETEYGWTHMPNTFSTGDTEELIFHCGVALNTDYGSNASWTTISNAESALENYFRYGESTQFVLKEVYSDTAWEDLLKNELDEGRPVLYKGDDDNGEHFFLIDGYQANNYFHINWGNEGYNNGYYYLSNLNPGGEDYTLNQAAVIGVIPSLGPDTIDENFENEFNDFNWVFGGNADWMIATDEHYYGIFSAKSGAINHNQTSQLMIDIDVFEDGEISFYKKVSSEDDGNNNYDHLAFYIDDVEIDRWGGEQNWSYESYPVTAGIHSFKWSYEKDGSLVEGNDCAWIDAIDFPEGGVAVDPPENLTGQIINNNNVELNWEPPSSFGEPGERDLIGYRVYRNGAAITNILDPTVITYLDQSLMNGIYVYYVKAVYDEGYSDPSNSVEFEIEILYPPTELTASISDDNVTLNWNAPIGSRTRSLLGYKIIRNDIEIDEISAESPTYYDADLPIGTYFYQVKAIYDSGISEGSNLAVAAIGVPNPPLNLEAEVVDQNDVQLIWNAPLSGRDLLTYKIYRNNIEIDEIGAEYESYLDEELANGMFYYYVKAVYDDGISDPSNLASVTVEIPYPPRNLTFQLLDENNVLLDWDVPVTEPDRNLNGYIVYRNDGQIATIWNPSVTIHYDYLLPNGNFTYYVKAIYGSVLSEPSNSVDVVVEVLYPPENLTADVEFDDVLLSWDIPSDGSEIRQNIGRSLTGYKIYRDNVEISEISDASTLTYFDEDLTNGTYSYFVTSIYDSGESNPSNTAIAAVGIPNPPLNVTADIVDGNDVQLNWQTPEDPLDLLGYKIFRNDQMLFEINDPEQLNYLDEMLANGLYEYYVIAVYTEDESDPSNIASVTIEVPYPPQNLTAEVIDDINIHLDWDAPSDNETGRELSGYNIFRNNNIIASIYNPSITLYQDYDLPNGVYEYYVCAVYGTAISEPSNIAQETIEVLYPPTDLVSEIINGNDIHLTWTLPENSGGLDRSFLGYTIFRNDVEYHFINDPQILEFADTNLANGIYSYFVVAEYDAGTSTPTNTVEEIVEVKYPPENLSSDVQDDDIYLYWERPTIGGEDRFSSRNLLSYKLYRDDEEIVQIEDPDSLSWIDYNLSNNIYNYYVTAIYDSGESEPSNVIEVIVEVLYPPTALISVIVDENNIELNWTQPATSGGLERSFIGYQVYRNNEIHTLISNFDELTYLDEDLTNGVYSYFITAIYDTGESSPTETVTETIEVLYPPIGLSADVMDDINVELNWTEPATSGGLDRSFIGYKVFRDNVEIVQINDPETLSYLDENLANGVYEYFVTAIYDSGESSPSNIVDVLIEALYPPTVLSSQIIDEINIELNWIQPVNSGGLERSFLGYKIYRNELEIAQISNPETLSYLDGDLTNGEYEYYVTAIYNSGESEPSNQVFEIIEILYPPINLISEIVDENNIELNWTQPATSGGLERSFQGYQVYRNGSAYLLVSDFGELSYLDEDLENGVYSYFVTAVYDTGESSATETVTETIEVLYPPTGLSAEVIDDINVELNWTGPATSGGLDRSFLGYKVYRDEVEIAQINDPEILTYLNEDLANGVYDYYITAIYDSGESESSNTATETIEVLYPPTELTSQIVNEINIELNWSQPATSGGLERSFIGYQVYRNNEIYTLISNFNELTYLDEDLENGVYSYFVTAVYDTGESSATETVTETIEVLYPPTGLSAEVIDDINVELNWTQPATSGGLERSFLGYKVYRDEVEITQIDNPETLSYSDEDLANGVYKYCVTAIYDSGESEPSNTAVVTIEVLYPPTGLTSQIVDNINIELNWIQPATSGGLERSFVGYQVYRNNDIHTLISDFNELTYLDEDLENGVYSYFVTAIYDTGESSATETVTKTIEVLYPPTELIADVIDDINVELNWTEPAISGGLERNLLGYKIYRDEVEIVQINEPETLSYLDEDLANGEYEYYVTAIYDSDESESSNIEATTIEALYPPTNLTADVNIDDVTLNWETPAQSGGLDRDFLGYLIYRNDNLITTISNPEILTYIDENLANATYSYYVKAMYNSGISEPSNTVEVFVNVMPDLNPPQNLTAEIINDVDVVLNWDIPEPSESDVLGYKLYRNGNEIAEVGSDILTYTDFGLENGVYSYFARTVYAEGLSSNSNTAVVDIFVMYPPENLTAEIINGNDVHLAWESPVRALNGFIVYRNSNEIAVIDNPGIVEYTDIDLDNGNYSYYVVSYYDEGISEPSNIVDVEIEVLYPATDLTAIVENDDVQLNWNAPATGSRDLLGYEIYRNDGIIAEINDPELLSYLDENLPNGIFSYYVISVYDCGNSEPSNTEVVNVQVLYPVTNLSGMIINETDIELSWEAPLYSYLMRQLNAYKIFRNGELLIEITDTAILNYSDSDLNNGIYSYYIIASYDAGDSDPSNIVELEIEILYPPTNLDGQVFDNDVVLNWEAPANGPAERNLLGYKVYRNELEIAEIENPAILTFTDEDLANGFYDYFVKAVYTGGVSESSNTINIEVEILYPTGLLTAIIVNENDVELSWEAPQNGTDRSLLGYIVFRNGIELVTISNPAQLTYTDENLANGSYDYYVVANYDSGNSEPSNTVNVNIEVLYPISGLEYEIDGDDITLTWNAPNTRKRNRDFLYYNIYRNDILQGNTTEQIFEDNNLANGIYNYSVTAYYTTGESEPVETGNIEIEILYPVTNLTAQILNDNDIELNWDAPANSSRERALTGYKIFRNDVQITEITDIQILTYLDEDLSNGNYEYYVVASYEGGDAESSNSVEMIIIVLYPPTDLAVEIINGNDVVLTWNAPISRTNRISDSSRDLIGYQIFRNGELAGNTPNTTFNDDNLANGDFEYTVIAEYDEGNSEPTLPVSANIEILYPVIELTAEILDGNDVQISWNIHTFAGNSVIGFKIYRDDIFIMEITDPEILTYLDEDLANGIYDYGVTAIYNSGESTMESVEIEVEILHPPTDLAALIINENDVELSWNAPETGLRILIGYKIYRNDLEITEISDPEILFYLDENLENGTYGYYVTAIYDGGDSEPSNIVQVIIDLEDLDENEEMPSITQLNGNYPNPFNPTVTLTTTIRFQLAEAGNVSLEIFNSKGQKVKTLINEHKKTGIHDIKWDGKDKNGKSLSPGIYLYRLRTDQFNEMKKMILM